MRVTKFEIKANGRRVGLVDTRKQANAARAKYLNYGYRVEIRRV